MNLREQHLLHSRRRPQDWRRWLEAAGIAGVDPEAGSVFESIGVALDAAAEGLGVALAIRALIDGDLASGRVVVPIPFCRRTSRSFVLMHKHWGFEEECEWRLISRASHAAGWRADAQPPHPSGELRIRPEISTLVPYFEIPLEHDGRTPIEEVVIGPTPHKLLASKAANMLFLSTKLQQGCFYRPSDIPYRTW